MKSKLMYSWLASLVFIATVYVIAQAGNPNNSDDRAFIDSDDRPYVSEEKLGSSVTGSNELSADSVEAQTDLISEDGETYTPDMEDRSDWPLGKIHPDLSIQALEQVEIEVVIDLKNKPLSRISREVKAQRQPQIEVLSKQVRDIILERRPKDSFKNRQEERLAVESMVFSTQQLENIKASNRQIDRLLGAMRKDISKRVKDAVRKEQQEIFDLIAQLNGHVTEISPLSNSIGAALPSYGALEILAQSPLVETITPDYLCELDLDDSTCMLSAGTWWNNGFDGGAYDAAVIDSGIREDHVYLNSHTIYKKTSSYDGSHGTRTAGVIASTHSTYKGVAFGLDRLFDARSGYESTSRSSIDWVLDCPDTTDSPEVINCSFSYYTITDEYGGLERFMDGVVDDMSVMVTKSAGNRGLTKLGYPQSRNLMSVANMDIKNTCSTSDDVIRYTSSRGPTDSGRRKPDITAPGRNTWSTDIASTTSFANHGGTSAAAPHVAGAIVLMEDAGNHNPMAQKAILINTAETWSDNDTLEDYTDDGPIDGDHWDETYGWGVMDLWHAHFHRTDKFDSSVYDRVVAKNDTATDNDYKLYKGHMYKNDKVTLVWHRRAVYNGSSEPSTYYTLTDLNLRLYDESNNNLVDSDTTGIDNVHQVSSGSSRDVVIKAYSWSSSIDGATYENYALATEENFERADPPSFYINLAMPAVVYFSTDFTVTATVTNNGDVAAHNNQVTLNLPSGFTLVSGASSQNIGKIETGSSGQATWTVRSSASGGTFSISVSNSSPCYAETYTASRASLIEVSSAGLPNLKYTTLSGWSYPIVPRSLSGATGTSCLITPTLPGNTNNTYYNWAWINDSLMDAVNHRTYIYMDGDFLFSSYYPLSAGSTRQHRNQQKPSYIATGGRHTLYYEIDLNEEVAESDESDNCWGRQFVWSPGALLDDVPVTRSAPPIKSAWGCAPSPLWFNNDGFSFLVQQEHPNKWWSAVGILPGNASSDYDMRLWDIGSYTGSQGGFGTGYIEWSTYGGDASNFVIVNDNIDEAGEYYAGVINDNGGTGDYRIEEDTSVKIYRRPGTQWNGPYTRSTANVLDIYEVYLFAGEYYFHLDQTVGDCNLGMSLYDDETDHARKSEFMTGAYATSTVGGQDASFQIIIPDDGFHGLVVWKVSSRDYSKSHTYRIAVGPPALTVVAPNGGETWKVGNLYSITWDAFGNLGHPVKIELSRDSGSTWSTITSSTANDGSYGWYPTMPGSTQCRIRITSTSDPSYTDTSDADFTISSAGIPAEINIKQGTKNIPHKIGSYDFGKVNLGYGIPVTFTIENRGGVNLDLTGSPRVRITGANAGDFEVTVQPSTPILPIESTNFEITFTPTAVGPRVATVSIPNTDSDENPYQFSLAGTGSRATTIYVDDDAPNDPGPNDPTVSDPKEDGSYKHPFDMIQEAIKVAFHDDTVMVLVGTYREDINLKGKNITVRSTDPQNATIVDNTVIDGRGRGSVVTFRGGENANCLLTGFTITGGRGSKIEFAGVPDVLAGGAIFCVNSSPTISNCIITHNKTELGGGIYASNSGMTIADCDITTNVAAAFHGGGIYITETSTPRIQDCSIMSNIAKSAGGGIASQSGSSALIVGNRVFDNEASNGGGLYIANSKNTKLSNNLIYRNRSTGTSEVRLYDGGGAMQLWGAPILCESCVFYGNSAVVEGGAIQCAYTKGAVLSNCIFWDNSAPAGQSIYLRYTQGTTTYPSVMTVSYSDLEKGLAGIVVEKGCTLNYGPDNIDADPLFVDTANGDFHLESRYGHWDVSKQSWVNDKYTSKCIDKGDPTSDWTAELWPHGQRINMGAYGGTPEASKSPSTVGNPADFNHDGFVDELDLRIFSFKWLVEEVLLPEDLNSSGFVDFIDYGIFGNEWRWEAP